MTAAGDDNVSLSRRFSGSARSAYGFMGRSKNAADRSRDPLDLPAALAHAIDLLWTENLESHTESPMQTRHAEKTGPVAYAVAAAYKEDIDSND